jgi:hypothetical protein
LLVFKMILVLCPITMSWQPISIREQPSYDTFHMLCINRALGRQGLSAGFYQSEPSDA